MDEPTTHDDGTDDVVAQLRRYASVAEQAVAATPMIDTTPISRRSARPWFAAAAVVALLGGAFAVFSATQDDEGRSVRAIAEPVPAPDPAPDPGNTCPAPRADGPLVDDLHVPESAAMVGVMSATTIDDQGDVDSIRLDIGEGAVELKVADIGATELAETFPSDPSGYEPVSFEICDPFASTDRRSTVRGQWVVDPNRRLRAELGLADGAGRGWLVTASTSLDRADLGGDPMDAAKADLHRLIAEMSWPASVETQPRTDACANEPVAMVGDHQLLAIPEGYTLGEPEEVDTGAVDMGGERWTRLPLLGPEGSQIDVISIGTATFGEALANNAVGTEPGSLDIRRCATNPVIGGEDTPGAADELVEIRRSEDRTVLGAQESEYGGWMVIGTNGATEADVIATAEAIRS